MNLAETITRHYGGNWFGSYGTYPGEGHGRKDRSVSIKDAPDKPEGVVLKCHAPGDDWRAELDRLRRDRFVPAFEPRHGGNDNCRPMFEKRQRQPGLSYFEFQDADGVTVCRKVRTDTADGKTFAWQHPDGKGGWAKGRDCDPLPYRLPDLLAAPADAVIYIAEGERKADKLASWGLVATSSKDLPADLSAFRGRTVAILPDNDSDGAKIANKLLTDLAGIAERAVLVELPGLPPKGDVIDWRGTEADLRGLTERALDGNAGPAQGLVKAKGITARDLMRMKFEPIRYVVPGYIAEGLTVFAGAPKIGKSWMSLGLGIAVASGGTALGGIPCEQGDVLYLALEDNPRRLQRRLRQMQMFDLPDRLTIMFDWPDLDGGCLSEIERWLQDTPAARMVIVDVFAKIKGTGKGERPQYEMDYAAAAGLQKLAGEYGVAIVAVHHTRKMEADDPFDAVSGTRGLTGAADTVLVLKRDAGSQTPILYGRGRDIEEIESAMQFDKETGWWSVIGDASTIAKTNERQVIMDALREACEPMGPQEAADVTGQPYQNVRRLMARMAMAGEIEKRGRGKYTCPIGPNGPNETPSPQDTVTPEWDSPPVQQSQTSRRRDHDASEWDNGTDGTGVSNSWLSQDDDEGWIGESPSQLRTRLRGG